MIKQLLTKASILLCLVVLVSSCQQKRSGNPKILVFSKTTGFHHSSISAGNTALLKLGQENNMEVDTTSNADIFNEDSLKNYSAVVFLNTSGDVLNNYQEADFERYIQAGGGFVGIHTAAETEIDWGWYRRLVGGYIASNTEVKSAKLSVVDKSHASSKELNETWEITDEWPTFKNLNPSIKVLVKANKDVFNNPEVKEDSPISWYHDYDGGRSFYTAVGHQDASFSDAQFLNQLLGGIQYAIGKNYELDYKKAKTLRVPAEEDFEKVTMGYGEFSEPTEMAILPNLNILVAQRRGELMLFNQETKAVTQVGLLDVYHQTTVPNVNAEEGFMGLVLDPEFEKNNFIYAYYSPKDTSVNRLSRFEFKDNKLDLASEKIVLQFYSQRNICCHTGGSLAFGKDRTLFISTGDNSTPFDEGGQKFVSNGYSPRDSREGHEQYDVQRTSGNTNDLRGKILRIIMKNDGTYDIPDGNLFKKDEAKAKPEIYVMGNRNPYRISVDQKNGFLYWGEVGPDANEDNPARGPRGYDEVNQARQAGYFGWPYFVGNNYAYIAYNYETGESGEAYNPEKPINDSRNNTGLRELPAAQPAFIWYPYAASPDFPQVGSGGRNAMTGPIYYAELFPKETRYPEYYEGKLFIYDWIRGWVKAVTMLPNGDFDKMEPFMGSTKFANPIDMEVGPDGKLYVLEYGSGWFSKNPDSGISRVDYNPKSGSKQVPANTKTDGKDEPDGPMGHQEGSTPKGESLIAASDCKSCHTLDKKSVGPTYQDVAKKYKDNKDASALLINKILNGGSGVWGEVAMPAHPGMKEEEVKEMVDWILSL